MKLLFIFWDNVKVSCINFSYTNAHIESQKFYNKDMSNGSFCRLDFNLCSFDGVNIDGANFDDAIFDFATGINK